MNVLNLHCNHLLVFFFFFFPKFTLDYNAMQKWLTLPLLLVAFLLSRTSDTNYTNKATA